MMGEEFDHLLKSKLDTLNIVPEFKFDEEVLWKRIEPKIKRGFGNNWYPNIVLLILATIGLFYYFDNIKLNQTIEPIERFATPRHIDTIENSMEPIDSKIIEKIESSLPKRKVVKKDLPIPRSEFKDSIKEAVKVKPTIVDSRPRSKVELGSLHDKQHSFFKYVEKEVAYVHVYRPKKFIGFGWVFYLKGNGKTITKVKNGGYEVLKLKPGKTQFSIKKKKVDINLEAGKTYYLRASIINGIPIGKPHLEEVSKAYVKEEFIKD